MSKKIVQLILTILVLAMGLYAGRYLITTAPEAKRRPPERPVPIVEAERFTPQSYTVKLQSRGTIMPRTQSTLIPQVSGRIVDMGIHFRDGGFIREGEVLLEIERTDYELALTIARADLASARLTQQEERAQAKQAQSDWKKLGMTGKPDDLVLRKPQLAKAQANVASAEARVQQAELDLTRTQIIAPYDGRILQKQVDIGQVVSPTTQLATLYASDIAEVRLPLTDKQLGMLSLPEATPDHDLDKIANAKPDTIVDLIADLGGAEWRWEGRVVRTEGTFDTRSRQLSVIAQVADPFRSRDDAKPPLKIGQFVRAEIQGYTLENVFVLPRQIVSGDGVVLIMDENNRVERRPITILWQTADSVITRDAISADDRLITTPLPYSLNGMQVRTASTPTPMDKTNTTTHTEAD